jgi:glycosyltransferase involved in cell wall biosynthesis
VKILHVGALPSPLALDGVNATVWQAATAQASAGHKVMLLSEREPDETDRIAANAMGISLVPVPTGRVIYDAQTIEGIVRDCDVVHLHSVFILRQAMLARQLGRLGVPYVITPNGGLSPIGLRRGLVKKTVYSLLLERPRFRAAAAVSVVVPGEADDVRSYVPDYAGIIRYIPNPVDATSSPGFRWSFNPDNNRVVFLGRFDVLHKGLDLLWEIARKLPHLTFELYGKEDHRTRKWFAQLLKEQPKNVHLKKPVFGPEKDAVLAGAALYLQSARWDGFPLSVAEAMLVGVPCALASRINAGRQFLEEDLGLTFEAQANLAAPRIDHALRDRAALERWSARARGFALNRFDARQVGRQFLDLYREVLRSAAPAVEPALAETLS